LNSISPARVVHQNPTHHLRRHGEKLDSRLNVHSPAPDQAQVGFIDQGRGLKQMPGPFAAHAIRCHPPQFFVNYGH